MLTGQDNIGQTTQAFEYPEDYVVAVSEPYYPVPREESRVLYRKYAKDAGRLKSVTFAGRLADYKITTIWIRLLPERLHASRRRSLPVAQTRTQSPTDHLCPHATAYRATLVEQVGGWNERVSLFDDFELFTRILTRSSGVRFTPHVRLYYFSGIAGRLWSRKSRKAMESAFLSISLGTRHLFDADARPRAERAA